MSNLDETILDAAFSVIQRYGVKRTTMSDFAKAAGVSRQTVYARYANKEELLRAITRRVTNQLYDNIQAAAQVSDMSQKLSMILDHMVVKPFEMLEASPDAADIMLGFATAAKAEMQNGDVRIRAALKDVFSPYARKLETHAMTPGRLTDFIKVATRGIKENTTQKDELLSQVEVLKSMVMAVLR